MASSYGWAKKDIDETIYFDELYELVQQINKRKISDWKMELAIVQNPHVKDPKQLWQMLSSYDRLSKPENDKLDKAGFAMLKDALSGSNRIMVK